MITVRCLFLFPSALKYETLISANGFFKNVVTYYRIIISVWSLRPGLCWYVCVVFCSHPFSPTYTCTSGDKSFTSHLFFKKKISHDKEVASMCATTTCSNELLFPVKNSTESTCCSLKIMHPNRIVSLHGSCHAFTHSCVALECCSEWCNKPSMGIKADILSIKKF